ncbi:hypothetical protein HGM15179_008560 [Zosterops borbonicus]|uniref:Uncharacterized protein n=1 Tax=Zosterops borbonicus TaxID=364589 RepID=A0A8K1LLZ8_9PASS|nr:hypothetical protein HGM15179_008560 [Zosterops borbonicus]
MHRQSTSMDTVMDMAMGTGCLSTPTAVLLCCTSGPAQMFLTVLKTRNVPVFDLGSVNSPENSGQCDKMPACWTRCNELDSINLKLSEAEAKDKKYE